MKRIIGTFLALLLLTSCTKSEFRNTNPNIPNYNFSVTINESLPLYSGLKTPINPIYIGEANVGFRGIFVMKVSDGDYRAWEASRPNQNINECTKALGLEGATNAKCKCDGEVFSLFTGVGTGKYTLKPYRVEVLDAQTIRVFN